MREQSTVVELDGRAPGDRAYPVFRALQSGAVVVLRDLPEVQVLAQTIREQGKTSGAAAAQSIATLLQDGDIDDLDAYAAFYGIIRNLRNARFLSCLFADLVAGWDLPFPTLIDSGYCRMVIPRLYEQVAKNVDSFDPAEFGPGDPNEAEHMLFKSIAGRAHRDINVHHYHFQSNIWFPLHDLSETRTLLLFPESYRRDVPQYGAIANLDAPAEWGFGAPLQIALKLGDALLFHSQQFHASPSQAIDRNRFTVEIRLASGCIDDNSRIYRRLFWQLRNFEGDHSADGRNTDSKERAKELVGEEPHWSIDHALAGLTAHAVVHRLFTTARCSLGAGFVRRPDTVLDAVHPLTAADWRRVLERLDRFECGEDLLILVARLLRRQGQAVMAADVLQKISAATPSYFWALEAGYFAAAARAYGLCEIAFARAESLAKQSSVALDRFTPGMPPPRSDGVLQLLPERAVLIAHWFNERIRRGETIGSAEEFDHRNFWQGPLVPAGATGTTSRTWSDLPRLLGSLEAYNVVSYREFVYGLPQALGPLDLTKTDVTGLDGVVRDVSREAVEGEIRNLVLRRAPAPGQPPA